MKYVERKAMKIRPSGRSSDYITPSFGFGCLYRCSYCYMRRHIKSGITIATNTEALINAIDEHLMALQWPKQPNQTHSKYYTYDFSCNEDYVKHAKYHNWELLFDYFKDNDRVMGTAATKYVNKSLLKYNPERKVRIRFSLMPQKLSSVLEPGTSSIVELFKLVDDIVDDNIKEYVKCECIFLTHNVKMHKYNIDNNVKGEEYLWTPGKQESKLSQFGGRNIRYSYKYKAGLKEYFIKLHNNMLPWQEIRYIF